MIVTFRSTTGAIPIAGWEAVVYGNGRFLALASSSSLEGFRFANSPTGDFWNGTIPPINFWNDLAYGAGKCGIVGERNGTLYDGAYTEDFGDTWITFQITPNQLNWEKIHYAAGKWVTMSPGTVAVSTDALVSWTAASLPENCDWRDITYGGGLWVAVSPNATLGKVITSTDGLNWTQRATELERSNLWKR